MIFEFFLLLLVEMRVYLKKEDYFDITRKNSHHLGFGHGIHACMGMHLAQMKMISLLKAMIPRVRRIEKDDPEILLNKINFWVFKTTNAVHYLITRKLINSGVQS